MGDWLGTGNVATKNRKFRPFKEARKYARSLGLKNNKEWRNYCTSGDLPVDIPTNPNRTYTNQDWVGYDDWLGKDI